MADKLIRAISSDGQIRALAANTTNLVQELQTRQQTWPVATAALGRTATMGLMMGYLLKDPQEQVSIQIAGDGPIGKISVDADGRGGVRGMVEQPQVDLPLNAEGKLDVAGAVGQGSIYIQRDLGLKKPYQGSSPIISGELAEDFTYYFATSEQTPSSVGLGVLVRRAEVMAAGGYLIQLMPEASEVAIDRLEANIVKLRSITDVLKEDPSPENLLKLLLGDELKILAEEPVQFACRCSHDRVANMLRSLGKAELTAILNELGQAEVICHYCQEQHLFPAAELEKLIMEMN